MNNSNNFFNKIKETTKISEVVKQYISIDKVGSNFKAICPFHGDKNPSLSINDEKGIYKCFSCNNSGDMFSFVANYKNINRFQAAKEIIDTLNLDINLPNNYFQQNEYFQKLEKYYDLNQTIGTWYLKFLYNKENEFTLNYLKNRGLDQNDIEYFKIGYAPTNNVLFDLINKNFKTLSTQNELFQLDKLVENSFLNINDSGHYRDFFNNRIMFSILNKENKWVGFSGRSLEQNPIAKYLNTKTTEVFKKEKILYNFNNVLKNTNNINSLFIFEGFMDVIKAHKSGVINSVATMGVELSKLHLEDIANSGFTNLIFCFDNDKAGNSATIKLINNLVNQKKINIFIVEHKDSTYKDIDEFSNLYGYEKTKTLLNQHVHASLYLLNQLIKENDLNQSQLSSLFNNAINIIKKHGRIEFSNNYKDFLITNFKIEESIVLKTIHDIFNNKVMLQKDDNYYDSKNYEPKQINNNYNNTFKKKLNNFNFESYREKQRHAYFRSVIQKMYICNPKDTISVAYEYTNFLESDHQNIFNILEEYYKMKSPNEPIFLNKNYINNKFEEYLNSKYESFPMQVDFLKKVYLSRDIYESNSVLVRLEIDWMNLKLIKIQNELAAFRKSVASNQINDPKLINKKIADFNNLIKEVETDLQNQQNATKWVKKDEI